MNEIIKKIFVEKDLVGAKNLLKTKLDEKAKQAVKKEITKKRTIS